MNSTFKRPKRINAGFTSIEPYVEIIRDTEAREAQLGRCTHCHRPYVSFKLAHLQRGRSK